VLVDATTGAVPISFDLGRDVALRAIVLTYVIDQVTRFAPVSLKFEGTNKAGVTVTKAFSSAETSMPSTCTTRVSCVHTVTFSTSSWADVSTVVLSELVPFYETAALSEVAFMVEVSQSAAAQCHPRCPHSLDSSEALEQAWRNDKQGDVDQDDYAYERTNHPMGDHKSLASAAWYRIAGDAGVRMPSQAPGTQKCGSANPGWLSTPHPTVGSSPSAGKVCFQSGTNECWQETKVEVCACSYDNGATTTYSYKLPKPPYASHTYCGTFEPMVPPPLPAPPLAPRTCCDR